MEIAEVTQRKIPYFRFWRLLKCVRFFPWFYLIYAEMYFVCVYNLFVHNWYTELIKINV